eukprot:Awhi_evm1s4043
MCEKVQRPPCQQSQSLPSCLKYKEEINSSSPSPSPSSSEGEDEIDYPSQVPRKLPLKGKASSMSLTFTDSAIENGKSRDRQLKGMVGEEKKKVMRLMRLKMTKKSISFQCKEANKRFNQIYIPDNVVDINSAA